MRPSLSQSHGSYWPGFGNGLRVGEVRVVELLPEDGKWILAGKNVTRLLHSPSAAGALKILVLAIGPAVCQERPGRY